MKRRYDALQAIRGIAAIMVVVYHAATAVSGLWNRPYLGNYFSGTSTGVEVFFVLSGIVICLSHINDIGQVHRLPTYVIKRVKRIYPIYWVTLTAAIAWHLLGKTVDSKLNPWVIVSSYLLVHIHSTGTMMDVAWTLFHEVMFYGLFSILFVSRAWGFVVVSIWGLASLATAPWGQEGYYAFILHPDHVLFIVGIVIAFFLNRGIGKFAKIHFWVGIGLYIIVLVEFISWRSQISQWLRLEAGLAAAFVLYGSSILEQQGKLHVPRWMCFLGDASYSIYLIHLLVISTLSRVIYNKMPVCHGLPEVVCVSLVGIGILTGALMHLYVERPLLYLFNRSKTRHVI